MRYVEFKALIVGELERHPLGKTYSELRESLDLPYERPCPTWVARLEQEAQLDRSAKRGNALIWRVQADDKLR